MSIVHAMAITLSFNCTPHFPKPRTSHLCKGRRPRVGVDPLVLGGAVGKREFEVLGKELLDVRTADRVCAVDFNDLEDL